VLSPEAQRLKDILDGKIKPTPPADDDAGDGSPSTPDDDGGGGGGGEPAPAPAKPAPAKPAPAKPAPLPADVQALARAAARRAAEAEAAGQVPSVPSSTPKPAAAAKAVKPVSVSRPAPAMAAGGRTVPFVSMPAAKPSTPKGYDAAKAKSTAAGVAAHIRTKGKSYTRDALATFQRHAGIVADGLYGPLSVSALKFYGVKSPPAALFGGTQTAYKPPT
jgi:hypothetical protein